MITNFKIYESIYKMPKIGDYIIITTDMNDIDNDIVGKVTSEEPGGYFADNSYYIDFDDLRTTYWSNNKEELEEILKEKKYNL